MARRALRSRFRRNPGPVQGAGDAELLLTVALVGAAIYLGVKLYQQVDAGVSSVESSVSSSVQTITNIPSEVSTAVEGWWSDAESWVTGLFGGGEGS